MNSYDFESLKAAAEKAGVWIDVQDANTRRGRGTGNTNIKERISRALSWYAKSESAESADEKLIFAFVAFNALYARGEDETEQKIQQGGFLAAIAGGEFGDEIFAYALSEIKNLKKIFELQYLSRAYWSDKGGMREKYEKMQKQKKWAEKYARELLARREVSPLQQAVHRVYLLRNQILHGMAAYRDSYNRRQVQLCANFLHPLVGRMIAAVIRDKTQNWGKAPFPPQGYPNESRIEVEELED